MVFDLRERAAASHAVIVPRVMEKERRAVVDQPEPAVPHQEIAVARRAIDVGNQGVEPDDLRRQAFFAGHRSVDQWIEGDRAWKVIESEIEPFAAPQKVLNFSIRLGPGHPRIDIRENDLGNGKAEVAGDLTGDELGDQRANALPGSSELENVR